MATEAGHSCRNSSRHTDYSVAGDHSGRAGRIFGWVIKRMMGKVPDAAEQRLRMEMTRSLPVEQLANFVNGGAGFRLVSQGFIRWLVAVMNRNRSSNDEDGGHIDVVM